MSVNNPPNLRVEHVSHEEFAETSIKFDVERRDYVLSKIETIPGLREENEHGFQWTDPVTEQVQGGLVAFPPSEWSSWETRRRVWCRTGSSSPRLSEARQVWPAVSELPEGRVSRWVC